jgi:hypothetical protein
VAGAIFAGKLDREACNWLLLPSGERIKTKASDWVYDKATHEFRLLMTAIYAYANHQVLPFAGGLLDQPIAFLDAVKDFRYGETAYAEQNRKTGDVLKSLGARKK